MNYYIIKAKKDAGASFRKIFVDNNYQLIAYQTYIGELIRFEKTLNITTFLKLSVEDSRGFRRYTNTPNRFYHQPRRLTENEYIELFNILL